MFIQQYQPSPGNLLGMCLPSPLETLRVEARNPQLVSPPGDAGSCSTLRTSILRYISSPSPHSGTRMLAASFQAQLRLSCLALFSQWPASGPGKDCARSSPPRCSFVCWPLSRFSQDKLLLGFTSQHKWQPASVWPLCLRCILALSFALGLFPGGFEPTMTALFVFTL